MPLSGGSVYSMHEMEHHPDLNIRSRNTMMNPSASYHGYAPAYSPMNGGLDALAIGMGMMDARGWRPPNTQNFPGIPQNTVPHYAPASATPVITPNLSSLAPQNTSSGGGTSHESSLNSSQLSEFNETFQDLLVFSKCSMKEINSDANGVAYRVGMRAVGDVLGLHPTVCSCVVLRSSEEVLFCSQAFISILGMKIKTLSELGDVLNHYVYTVCNNDI